MSYILIKTEDSINFRANGKTFDIVYWKDGFEIKSSDSRDEVTINLDISDGIKLAEFILDAFTKVPKEKGAESV